MTSYLYILCFAIGMAVTVAYAIQISYDLELQHKGRRLAMATYALRAALITTMIAAYCYAIVGLLILLQLVYI
jgi:hypothetical protein